MTVMNPARMATGAAAGGDYPSGQKAAAARDRSAPGFDDLLTRSPQPERRAAETLRETPREAPREASASRFPASFRPASLAPTPRQAAARPAALSRSSAASREASASRSHASPGSARSSDADPSSDAAHSSDPDRSSDRPPSPALRSSSWPAKADHPRLAASNTPYDGDPESPADPTGMDAAAVALAPDAVPAGPPHLAGPGLGEDADARPLPAKDEDSPAADAPPAVLAWIAPAPPLALQPAPPPAAGSMAACETSNDVPAGTVVAAACSAATTPHGPAVDVPAAAALRKPDPENLIDALGLRPVTPQALTPPAPMPPGSSGADPTLVPPAPSGREATAGQGAQADAAAPIGASIGPSATQPIAATGAHTQAADPSRQIAMRLKRAVNSGEDILTIELHPAELGRVSVRLGFHEGRVDVRLVVDRQSTFDAFSQDRAALEQQLAQAGIDLGSGGLDLRFGGGGAATPEAPVAPAAAAGGASAEPIATASPVRLLAEGLVDITA